MAAKFIKLTWVGHSERLLYRELSIIDAEQMYALNKDPDVIKYTGDSPFKSVAETKTFLSNYNPYASTGFGRWCVISKSTGKTLGWCGLKRLETGEVDLGYRFFKKYWNHGFATESSLFSIELAKNKYQLNELIGRAVPENFASRRVLEKVGFSYSKSSFDGIHDVVTYLLKL